MILLTPFLFAVGLLGQILTRNKEWWARFGFYSAPSKCDLWIHTASLGEVNAVIPLVDKLKEKKSDLRILLTSNTATGLAQARRRILPHYSFMTVCHPPYDIPLFVRRFMKAFNPRQLIIMEADIWPFVLSYCGKKKVPRLLVNARLTKDSLHRKKKLSFLFPPLHTLIDLVCAQTTADARRFIGLGMQEAQVTVCGNLKFDASLPRNCRIYGKQLRSLIGPKRKIWIAASTHRGEEEAAFFAHRQLLNVYPRSFMILVPRHPRRFEEVASMCRSSGFRFTQLSRHCDGDSFSYPQLNLNRFEQNTLADAQILLGDTINDLPLLYASADIAFVGGSLVAKGGHNILEPAQLGLPVLLGPSDGNIAAILAPFVQAGAAIKIKSAEELASRVIFWLKKPPPIRKNLEQLLKAHRGAAECLVEHIDFRL